MLGIMAVAWFFLFCFLELHVLVFDHVEGAPLEEVVDQGLE